MRPVDKQPHPSLLVRVFSGPMAVFIGFGVVGLLLTTYKCLDEITAGDPPELLTTFIEEMSSTFGAAVLFFAVRRITRRPSSLAVHAAALPIFSALHTTMNWTLRTIIFAAAGLGRYDYGLMPTRYFMELPVDCILYTTMVAGIHLVDHYRAQQDHRTRAAELASQLSRAQLENLQIRLQPHFLFNTLNMISSKMYETPALADEMISHLAELLRVSLETQRTHEVTLREELHALHHYIAIMQARFGQNLEVTVEADPPALDRRVPALLIQPLVENAVRHGSAATGPVHVRVEAKDTPAGLEIEVRDSGRGPGPATGSGTGLGLSLTAERLKLLYGDRHNFDASPHEQGGFRVAITIHDKGAHA